MPLDPDARKVLVIGSGPVVIGQAAEFDYAGSQACLSLREEGIMVVLLNSNPATIQSDKRIADRVYIEPMTVPVLEEIIVKENIDAVLPTMGGQTALNLCLRLFDEGILDKHGVKVIGTQVQGIRMAEDRVLFSRFVKSLGEPVAESVEMRRKDLWKDEYSAFAPGVMRTSFSLGGSGGRIYRTFEELMHLAEEFFQEVPDGRIEVEKSLQGLKELEYEMIRDSQGNCICICNMENIDPMGVHTGESIVVTPSQTLSDQEYHMLRSSAIRIVSGLGIVGACNIQFALDQSSSRYYVVEVNPRTSRSSALASKASGYPIARIASKLAVGYSLAELRNPVTGDTYAAYEPSLDYITVKIPRWPFDKFGGDRKTGVQMKSVGEVMGIGRTFEEAFMKALSSIDTYESARFRLHFPASSLEGLIREPSDLRIFAVIEALFQGHDPDSVAGLAGFDPYFVHKMKTITAALLEIQPGSIPRNLPALKRLGIPDSLISRFASLDELTLVRHRIEAGIIPVYKSVDTCSGEFRARTPYLYSTYENEDETPEWGNEKSVLVIGSGPNRIAQGLEFDYGAVKAVSALREMGYRTIMLNSNPETVSTDFDVSDMLYFEPVTLEHVSNVIVRAKAWKVIVQLSGQTGQNLASQIASLFGDDIILGTPARSIEAVEDRARFSESLQRLGILQPPFAYARNSIELEGKLGKIGLPVIMRASNVIGGRSMDIIFDLDTARERFDEIIRERPEKDVLISGYLDNAVEIDVDFISHRGWTTIMGIITHIEEAGTHSGDATMVFSGHGLPEGIEEELKHVCSTLSREFLLDGISNLQAAVRDDQVFVIELNARASRTVPFLSKATGTDWVGFAVRGMVGSVEKIYPMPVKSVFIKYPIFPFRRFPGEEPLLGPEMKSTGEAMVPGMDYREAIRKLIDLIGVRDVHAVLLTVRDQDKQRALGIASNLSRNGIRVYSTPGTATYLSKNGIRCSTVYRMEDMRTPRVDDIIKERAVDVVVNTPTASSGSMRDGYQVRQLCIRLGIPLITNISLASILLDPTIYSVKAEAREISEYT